MAHPLLLSEAFGVGDYAHLYSRSQLVATLGVAGGPALVGLVHDAAGGYRTALLGVSSVSVLALIVLARSDLGTPGAARARQSTRRSSSR
jgi:hypothetical protein